MTGDREATMVALPVSILRMLVVAIGIAVVVMVAMLAIEVVILFKVFDLIDLVEQIVPAA